jgi:hypothetical protein
MLFDLRGRGRRRTVRVLYIGLAVLIGLGLVGFGVGTGFGGGGIFSAATGEGGGGSKSYSAQVKKYEKLTRQQPSNVAAWEYLTKALLNEGTGSAYVNEQGAVSSKGRELFKRASAAWTSYLALNPPKANPELANRMVSQVYGEQALNEPARAVQAMQIVLETRPTSASLWSQLAIYAYRASNTRVGDLASQNAVRYAPEAQRTRLKNELAEVKKNGSSGPTYTTTTNGKTYVVKSAGGGSYTGTEVKTTPPPASSTGTGTTKK